MTVGAGNPPGGTGFLRRFQHSVLPGLLHLLCCRFRPANGVKQIEFNRRRTAIRRPVVTPGAPSTGGKKRWWSLKTLPTQPHASRSLWSESRPFVPNITAAEWRQRNTQIITPNAIQTAIVTLGTISTGSQMSVGPSQATIRVLSPTRAPYRTSSTIDRIRFSTAPAAEPASTPDHHLDRHSRIAAEGFRTMIHAHLHKAGPLSQPSPRVCSQGKQRKKAPWLGFSVGLVPQPLTTRALSGCSGNDCVR